MLNAKSQKKKSTGFGITPYLFVIPGMLLFFLIAVIPIFQTFGLSFTDWDGVKAFSSINIIGLDNYKTVITGQEFHRLGWS